MSAPFLTASAVDLFRACRYSAIVPKVWEDARGYAQAGTDAHAETLAPGRLPPAFAAWFGDEPRFESAFAWDGSSAHHLGDNLQRAYELPDEPSELLADAVLSTVKDPESSYTHVAVCAKDIRRLRHLARAAGQRRLWLAGTADACSIRGDVVSVADLKTGRRQAAGSGRGEAAGTLTNAGRSAGSGSRSNSRTSHGGSSASSPPGDFAGGAGMAGASPCSRRRPQIGSSTHSSSRNSPCSRAYQLSSAGVFSRGPSEPVTKSASSARVIAT